MKNFKKTFAFIFFVLAGIVLGAFIAYLCSGKAYVGWLAWGKELGIQNAAIDLYVIRFNVGLMFNATVSQLITIPLAIGILPNRSVFSASLRSLS